MLPQRRSAWLVGSLFIGSGCAALIYELVWFHLLGLVIGASAVSLSILLASFMAGLCLGSLLWPKCVSPSAHPLRVYAFLEAAIAVCGMVIVFVLPYLGQLYWPMAGEGWSGTLLRGLVSGGVLLVPTMLMGATLPAVARWVKTTRAGCARLGWFYGMNTFGAVLGTLLTGLFLLPRFDVYIATLAAMAINLLVAAVAWGLARGMAFEPPASPRIESEPSAAVGSWPVYLVVLTSGATALGAEVVWTRLLSLLFGPTTYTFSILLAVYLIGLGLGSAVGAWLSRRLRRPLAGLVWGQLLLAAAIPYGAFVISRVLPFWWADRVTATSATMQMGIDLIRAATAMLPATLLWGASFPLAVAACGRGGRDAGLVVGRLYAANTFGAIGGALVFGLGMLPGLGTHAAQQVLTLACVASAWLAFASLFQSAAGRRSHPGALGLERRAVVGIAAASVAAALLTAMMPAAPPGLMAFGRRIASWDQPLEYLTIREGLDATVAVSQRSPDYRDFHVSGKVVASNDPLDLRIERMLGHLPAMAHGKPTNALVIGCGAGVTAGSLLVHPSVESVVICEIEAHVPPAAHEWFSRENYGVVEDPRTRVVHDDGRHFLASHSQKYDLITSDPIHPWVRGAAALYSKEFLALCRSRLNPGGVLALWVPLYESNAEAVRCEVATFREVFPDCTIWSSDLQGGGYDVVLLGSADGVAPTFEQLQHAIAENDRLRESLAEVHLGTPDGLLRIYAGRAALLDDWLAEAPINRDSNLRLQYLAGRTPDLQMANEIFREMWTHMQQPAEPFSPLGN